MKKNADFRMAAEKVVETEFDLLERMDKLEERVKAVEKENRMFHVHPSGHSHD